VVAVYCSFLQTNWVRRFHMLKSWT